MSASKRLNLWWLLIFFVICYATAALGAQFTPGDWYKDLVRAPWTPPNAAFPIVWTILYAMIAVAGWLIFSAADKVSKVLWVAQLILNSAWSWIFFAKHWTGVALVDIVILLCLVALLINRCLLVKTKTAAWLLVPYLIWLLIATSLNVYIVAFN